MSVETVAPESAPPQERASAESSSLPASPEAASFSAPTPRADASSLFAELRGQSAAQRSENSSVPFAELRGQSAAQRADSPSAPRVDPAIVQTVDQILSAVFRWRRAEPQLSRRTPAHDRLKRAVDMVAAFLMLLASLPLMCVLALCVRWDSAGPVFYKQTRVGENRRRSRGPWNGVDRRRQPGDGRPIKVVKFRSMRVDAEALGKAVWCQANDPRVTRVGHLLRLSHLDELPQLINVLRGEMSLVGPRPERPEFVEKLKSTVPLYDRRLLMKPGLTGLSQVRYRSDREFWDVRQKIRYDMIYLRTSSFVTDVSIMLSTVPLMFGVPPEKLKRLNLRRYVAARRWSRAAERSTRRAANASLQLVLSLSRTKN